MLSSDQSSALYHRLPTREVRIGSLLLGNGHPIRIQTMTTTDTMDTAATVAQTIRCIEAGAELVRITAPSKREAENLLQIRNEVRAAGFNTPLVADIHFTPNAAEIAARIIEKVRVNPGNYVDKKKFDLIDYTDIEYQAEIDRIRERFTPLVRICKDHGTAMRIGTNHGSLSDRIMSRYGDTPIGMVESAMEFLRIARYEDYHQIVLSMKSSNPLVVVQAYRLLVQQMQAEFGECYPLHLGVTEAGDGEDGRIKSAIGIGTLLEEGIGDTIRVSLTEDPEFEIPVCRDIVKKYAHVVAAPTIAATTLPFDPFHYKRRATGTVGNIGAAHVPVVVADFMQADDLQHQDLNTIGYQYNEATDKWNISDGAADYIFLGDKKLPFDLPGTLRPVITGKTWSAMTTEQALYIPCFELGDFVKAGKVHPQINFVSLYVDEHTSQDAAVQQQLELAKENPTVVFCLVGIGTFPVLSVRRLLSLFNSLGISNPLVLGSESHSTTIDGQLIELSTNTGALLLDGIGDGVWLMNDPAKIVNTRATGRTYLEVKNNHQSLNNTSFSILQATRTRISKTEYISCPSCGRTLFDLQETTAKIRAATHHLKGLKIAVMGCIVNGPGEMADADFGYVGSGPGKITLYKGKEVMKKNVESEVAVAELIQLLKDNEAWIDQ